MHENWQLASKSTLPVSRLPGLHINCTQSHTHRHSQKSRTAFVSRPDPSILNHPNIQSNPLPPTDIDFALRPPTPMKTCSHHSHALPTNQSRSRTTSSHNTTIHTFHTIHTEPVARKFFVARLLDREEHRWTGAVAEHYMNQSHRAASSTTRCCR